MPRSYVTPKGITLTYERALGAGQFGIANAVRNRRGELFCLKEVSVHTADDDAMEQVVREVDVMKETCTHPNIITFYDSWFERERLCILMEYCSNSSLDKLILRFSNMKKRFIDTKIIFYMQELTSALNYLHHHLRIMHRDLKPANILIDEIGTLKLADFGLSKSLDVHTDLCVTFCGSPLYMSPEQCSGDSYSFSADVWSLGCILFELMALQSPWIDSRDPSRPSYPALVERIRVAKPNYEPLLKLYPERLIDLTKWMLCVKSNKRASALQIFDHLEMRSPPIVELTVTHGLGTKEFASLLRSMPPPPNPTPSVSPRDEENATDTLQRQADIVSAALRIQRSFRISRARGHLRAQAFKTEDEVLRPMARVPMKQYQFVAQKPHPRYTREQPQESAVRIQNAFRSSFSRRQNVQNVKVDKMTRLEQLAVPRIPPTTRFAPTSRRSSTVATNKKLLPQTRMLPIATPRPAWV
jgi:NIMA (never in mitosis gene a)-related kinase 1/4/5